MTLQGYYTNKGRALAAKVAGGTAALTITRVVAGSGHTADIPSATALPDIKQTLAVGTAQVSGSTATLPVTLSEAAAEDDYTLTELGVYATDPDEGEVLFQVYQLDASAGVTAHGEGVLRFYLRQSIGAQGVTVVCSGAGTLVEEDIAPLRARVMATNVPSRTVSVPLSGLQAYLDSLPRLLNEHLRINVSGNYTGVVTVNGFFGSGTLIIEGTSDCKLTGGVFIRYSSVFMQLKNMTIQGGAELTAEQGVVDVYSNGGSALWLEGCTLIGNGICFGVNGDISSLVCVVNCPISNCLAAIWSKACATVIVFNTEDISYSGNSYGGAVYRGGIILQGEGVPELMGGAANSKDGGIIAKRNGTLL